MKNIKGAWIFIMEDRYLRSEGKFIRVGDSLSVAGEPALQALYHGNGPIACLIENNTVTAMVNAATVLHTFACDTVERIQKKHPDYVDPYSQKAIQIKRAWVKGEANITELDEAHDEAITSSAVASWVAHDVYDLRWSLARAASQSSWVGALASAKEAATDEQMIARVTMGKKEVSMMQSNILENMLVELLTLHNSLNIEVRR